MMEVYFMDLLREMRIQKKVIFFRSTKMCRRRELFFGRQFKRITVPFCVKNLIMMIFILQAE